MDYAPEDTVADPNQEHAQVQAAVNFSSVTDEDRIGLLLVRKSNLFQVLYGTTLAFQVWTRRAIC